MYYNECEVVKCGWGINNKKMKKILITMNKFLIVFFMLSAVSCVQTPDHIDEVAAEGDKFTVAENFDWETLETKSVSLTVTSDVYTQEWKLLGENLIPGTYEFKVSPGTEIIIVEKESQEVANINTKAFDAVKAPSLFSSYLYFPSFFSYATYMYEDLFPSEGDLDFNDLVAGIRFKWTINISGKVTNMSITIQPRSVGSSFNTVGLGLKFNSNKIKITSVDNSSTSSLFSLNSNGTESGQSSCVVVPLTSNIREGWEKESGFINTFNNMLCLGNGEIKTINIVFDSKHLPSRSAVDIDNIALFAVFGERGREIFEKGNTPTDLFNAGYFTQVGKSDFSSLNNYVWGLKFAYDIYYPKEYAALYKLYPDFAKWAASGGVNYTYWYLSIINYGYKYKSYTF